MKLSDVVKIIPKFDKYGDPLPFFTKTEKQQIEGAPEGITQEKQLFDLIEELNGAEIVKTSKPLQKKISKFEEKNLDIMASAAELRKDYETLYLQIREEIYPKKKGDKK